MANDDVEELVKALVAEKITPEEFKSRSAKLTSMSVMTTPSVVPPSLGFEDDAMTRAEIRSQARIAKSI